VPPIQLAAAALDAEKDDSGISAARAVLLVKADVVQLAGVSERSSEKEGGLEGGYSPLDGIITFCVECRNLPPMC